MLVNKKYILNTYKNHLDKLYKQQDKEKEYRASLENSIRIESVKYIVGLIEEDMEKKHPSPLKSKKERR